MPVMNRIVSLLPSATEIICELGLGDRLVGVTHECDWPPFVRDLPKVTRTAIPHEATSREIDALVRERLEDEKALYSLDMEALARLRPDLIVTQALCDVCAVSDAEVRAAACALPGQPKVIDLEPMRLAEVFESLHIVAQAAGVTHSAEAAVARLESRVTAVSRRSASIEDRPSVVFLEWIDPPFCAGHWTPELIRLAGGIESIGQEGRPSRTIAWDEIVRADPEVLVLASCGFDVPRIRQDVPFLTGNPGFGDLSCVRNGRIFLIDGSAYFNRPGPRLVDSLEILANALHPGIHPLPVGLAAAERWS